MGLDEYWKKRDFGVTPEPAGEAPRETGQRTFCIQKHAASHLHYDFRLELKGVLKSWSVPKGPSYDPHEKRLAMETEDHPLEYGTFEGVIPAGQYGGGTVLLWDRGTWDPIEDPHKGYHTGRLKFRLEGEKLQGGWTLVKIKGKDARDSRSWLLIKETDETARPVAEYSVVEERQESVATGRTLDEIARARDRVWNSNREEPQKKRKARSVPMRTPDAGAVAGARKGRIPARLEPALATLVDAVPVGPGWVHEMKFDGYRILARKERGATRLFTRTGKDWTASFPTVAKVVQDLAAKVAVLDGEVAVVMPNGTTSFQALQNVGAPGAVGELAYFVFDLLHLDGRDLTGARLLDRKAALRALLGTAPGVLRFSDHVEGAGDAFLATACRHGLEGIISKRADAPYAAGRGRSWLKVKCSKRQEFVIAGYTDPEGARAGIGALLLGVNDKDGLRFAGKVGTGFTAKTLADLEQKLKPLVVDAPPFAAGKPKGVPRAHWVKPRLVAEVTFTEWTEDGRLRHPSFQGLRTDKPAKDVVREAAAPEPDGITPQATRKEASPLKRKATPGSVAGVKLTNPDRILFPEVGITKHDLALYYETVQEHILPHILGRPLTLVRCPEGVDKGCFYMKHSGVWAPPTLLRIDIQEKTKVGEYLYVQDVKGLVSLAQMGILEIHTWNSTVRNVEKSDRVVFDFDPDPSVAFPRVMEAARELRARLRDLGFESFVKTTGGKGLHVAVPLRATSYEDAFLFSEAVSVQMEKDSPLRYTTAMAKAARKNRILIDYLRNKRGNTSVAAFSTRARGRAPVSLPIAWEELTATLRPDQYTLANVPARVAARKDPWDGFHTLRQPLGTTARKLLR